jgi:hypothetical protein
VPDPRPSPRTARDRLLLAAAVLCLLVVVPAAVLAIVALMQGTILVDELPQGGSGQPTSPEYEDLGRRALVAGAVAALALATGILCLVRRYAGPAGPAAPDPAAR